MGEILRVFGVALEALEQVHPARPLKDGKLPGDQNKVKGVRYAFGLDQFTTRFAVRLSAVLCLGFGFVWLTGLEHAYWYPMTAFLMLMPYAEESRMKIGNRILGTLGGAVVSILLMSLFHTMPQYIAIMAVMTCFLFVWRDSISALHAQEHAQHVGDQPDQPHKDAEPVEALLLFRVAPGVDQGGPHRVEQHEHDGQRAGDAVGAQQAGTVGHGGHDGGAGGVEHQAAPEQDHVALLQGVGPALGKHAHGVKAQRQGNGDNGSDQLSGHKNCSFQDCTGPKAGRICF